MKTTLTLPDAPLFRERLSYNPLTGDLSWNPSDRIHFNSDGAWKRFNNCFVGKIAGHKHKQQDGSPHAVVVRISISGRDMWLLAHRIIFHMLGVPVPDGMEIDHENGNPWDNRCSNLRIATPKQNVQNTGSRVRKDPQSQGLPKGVSMQLGRFKAQIAIGGKKRHIGMFGTPEEAANAYRREAAPFHGEFLHASCRP